MGFYQIFSIIGVIILGAIAVYAIIITNNAVKIDNK